MLERPVRPVQQANHRRTYVRIRIRRTRSGLNRTQREQLSTGRPAANAPQRVSVRPPPCGTAPDGVALPCGQHSDRRTAAKQSLRPPCGHRDREQQRNEANKHQAKPVFMRISPLFAGSEPVLFIGETGGGAREHRRQVSRGRFRGRRLLMHRLAHQRRSTEPVDVLVLLRDRPLEAIRLAQAAQRARRPRAYRPRCRR
jgi:hypothetical protein